MGFVFFDDRYVFDKDDRVINPQQLQDLEDYKKACELVKKNPKEAYYGRFKPLILALIVYAVEPVTLFLIASVIANHIDDSFGSSLLFGFIVKLFAVIWIVSFIVWFKYCEKYEFMYAMAYNLLTPGFAKFMRWRIAILYEDEIEDYKKAIIDHTIRPPNIRGRHYRSLPGFPPKGLVLNRETNELVGVMRLEGGYD